MPHRLPVELGAALRHAEQRLRDAGVESPTADAAWLVEAVSGLSPSRQKLQLATRLLPQARRRLRRLLERRAAREPLQLVLGETEFFGLSMRVRPGVLVPRPETEVLVELALADLPRTEGTTFIDVGCGSGAVALAVAAARPDARVLASDLDPRALRLTRHNARALALAVTVHRSDLLASARLASAVRQADVLAANLPYLGRSEAYSLPPELTWDPPEALLAGSDGLLLARRLRAQAWRLLKRGAVLWLELDARNAGLYAREARMLGWREVQLAPDLVGRRRFVRTLR